MKIEIEIDEETAAHLFANNWGERGGQNVTEIIADIVADKAAEHRNHFPNSTERALEDFREHNTAKVGRGEAVAPH